MTMSTFTTATCKRLLPEVLIDYLWKWAAESGAETQTFVLSALEFGTGEVQDILHRRNGLSSWRQVFGYQPVEATVEVHISRFGATMSLKEDNAAPADTSHRKGEGTCSA